MRYRTKHICRCWRRLYWTRRLTWNHSIAQPPAIVSTTPLVIPRGARDGFIVETKLTVLWSWANIKKETSARGLGILWAMGCEYCDQWATVIVGNALRILWPMGYGYCDQWATGIVGASPSTPPTPKISWWRLVSWGPKIPCFTPFLKVMYT